ncbi:MAG TPA: hypothetical protein PLE19_12270 [Planctomycetota bacterium]|nr:hypothetical protein [Planctomycetota bacterium]HRR81829.1 hypothetical protein [Planctomycetota bacterium]HRT96663.1 hypothetical protein [Planctomycetota bacterium]
MTQPEFIQEIVRHLDQAGVPYMIVGSVASTAYGDWRTTLDTDIVVDAPWEHVRRFLRGLGPDYYFDEDAARTAWESRRMFNIIHFASGNKADIIRRKDTHYAATAFERRGLANALGTKLELCTPEDVILSKLDWCKRSESERQYRDALGVAKAQRQRLDLAYLACWAEDLGVTDLLNRLLGDAGLRPQGEPPHGVIPSGA